MPKGYPSQLIVIRFDRKAYIRDLKKELKKVTSELRDELFSRIMKNLQSIPFSRNEVRMADGGVTSDYERRSALLRSIIADRLTWIENRILVTHVTAMKTEFEKSHIGFYYEFGTGVYADDYPPLLPANRRDWNPFRPRVSRAPIVTRSRHIGNGIWTDLGGNKRITHSPRGGDEIPGFDIQAYHWFINAFLEVRSQALDRYKQAVARVHPRKYMYIEPKIILSI